MEKVKRYDVTPLEMGKNVKVTPQGFLIIDAFTARTGIQKYRLEDGSELAELRPENEVFSEMAIESLKTSAVTDNHPSEMVTPENAKELMVGHVNGDVEKVKDGGEKFTKAQLIITHKQAIDSIKAGKRQLSHGYTLDLDFTEGIHDGKKYDAIQRNIVNNHIAIVWKARAGKKASFKLDKNDAILITDNENHKGANLMKVTINGKEFELNDDAAKGVQKEVKALDEKINNTEKENKELKGKLDSSELDAEMLKKKTNTLMAKVDSLDEDLKKSQKNQFDEKEIEKRVKEKMNANETAEKILDKKTLEKLDEMSINEIKTAVVKADSPETDEEKLKNNDYLDARYDHVVERLKKVKSKKDEAGKKIVKNREEEKDDDADWTSSDARQAAMDETVKRSHGELEEED